MRKYNNVESIKEKKETIKEKIDGFWTSLQNGLQQVN